MESTKPAPVAKPEQWLTVQQVADLLQVTPLTVRNRIKSGEMPYRKVGRVYRIPAAVVTAPEPA